MGKSQNIVVSVLAIALAVISIILALNATNFESERTISVSGEATTTVSPDEAVVYVRVEHKLATAEQAQAAVSEDINSVIAALEKLVDEDSIETSSFQVYQNQRWNPVAQEYVSDGYIAVHVLKVTTEDINEVGQIIDDSIAAGANGVDSINFQLTDESQAGLRRQLLEQAGSDARQKADAIAAGLSVKVGEVVAVSESGPIFAPYAVARGEDAAKSSISPAQLDVSATVSIQYSIR